MIPTSTDSQLLDRLADQVPELDLDNNEIEWTTLPDGHEALLVTGGGMDGDSGTFFASCGEDLHAAAVAADRGLCRLHRDQAGCLPPPRSGGARPAGRVEDEYRLRFTKSQTGARR